MERLQQTADNAVAFLTGLIGKMGLDCEVTVANSEDKRVRVRITGKDNGAIIGYRGEMLDAIQYLTLLASNKGEDDFVNIVLDTENYREKRTKVLTDLALRLADKAYRTGRRVELEPMNPFERRIIHSALQGSTKATTESEGEGDNRHVVIIPLKSQEDVYDPYAPADGYDKKPITSTEFRRNGFGKMKRFGYKRGER